MNNLKFNFIQFFSLIILISSCGSNLPKFDQGELVFSRVFHFNLSKDDLYKYSLSWVSSKFEGIQKLEYSNMSGSSNINDRNMVNQVLVNTIISKGSYKIPEFSGTKIMYTCKIECKKNEAKITFSDFHYLIENEKKNILWKHMNRKIKKKLVFHLDSYILDFSEPANHEGLKGAW